MDSLQVSDGASESNVRLTHIIYALYAASLLVGVTSLVAIIMNYIKRDDVRGTYLESHFAWQIKTFWVTLIVGIIGAATSVILVGIPILIALFVWYIYRIAKGWLALNDGKPVGT